MARCLFIATLALMLLNIVIVVGAVIWFALTEKD